MSPLSLQPPTFHWGTGFENTFIPHARPRLRSMDQFELTQHYQHWRTDFDLAASLGVKVVRWGPPWYRVQPTPYTWDWRWTDEALDYAVNVKGLTVMLDLVHYGTPYWLEKSFVDPDYPRAVGEFMRHVARRYGSLLQLYTPLNEPSITALMCGRRGQWPPYLRGDRGYVRVMLGLVRGLIETVNALRAEQPEARTVQVEALWRFKPHEESLRERVALRHQLQYLAWDLATGRVDAGHPLHAYVLQYGARESDLAWFRANAVSFDVFGANFYPWGYGTLAAQSNGRLYRLPTQTEGAAIAEVLTEAHARYGLPIFITETSARGPQYVRARWMDETIATVVALRRACLPIIGYTWFPLLTMLEWRYRTGKRPFDSYLLHLGLFESKPDENGHLLRQPTPLVEQFAGYVAQPVPWGEVEAGAEHAAEGKPGN